MTERWHIDDMSVESEPIRGFVVLVFMIDGQSKRYALHPLFAGKLARGIVKAMLRDVDSAQRAEMVSGFAPSVLEDLEREEAYHREQGTPHA